jgi:hypothetical protein
MYLPSGLLTSSYTHYWIRTLTPHNSFSKLPISKEALLKLLTHYSVLPQFIDVLVTFGEKVEEIKENYGIYEQHIPQKSLATATDSHFLGK